MKAVRGRIVLAACRSWTEYCTFLAAKLPQLLASDNVTGLPVQPLTMSITIKTPEEIEAMRVAGSCASEVLDFITPYVKPGVATGELDRLCHEYMVDVQGTIPAPLNYAPPGYPPYPKSICASVKHQVCHGIPGDRPLKNGDILNLDITVIKDGLPRRHQPHVIVGDRGVDARQTPVFGDLRMPMAGHRPSPGRCTPWRHRQRNPTARRDLRLFDRTRVLRSRHRIARFTKNRKCCTTAEPDRHALEPGMIFTIEPMINAGRPQSATPGWLDDHHQGPQPLGPMGTHHPGHRDRLRGIDGICRLACSATTRGCLSRRVWANR